MNKPKDMQELVDAMPKDVQKFYEALSADQIEDLTRLLKAKADDIKDTPPDKPSASVDEDFTVSRDPAKNVRAPVSAGDNTWKDVGELKDIETPDFEKTPRNRRSPTTKEVSCHVCKKSFKVNESLLYGEFYRCIRCTGR